MAASVVENTTIAVAPSIANSATTVSTATTAGSAMSATIAMTASTTTAPTNIMRRLQATAGTLTLLRNGINTASIHVCD